MGKLRILPFLKLFMLVMALASYNLVPNLSEFQLSRQADSSYSQNHGPQLAYFHLQESILLKKEFSTKVVFNLNGDEASIGERFATPFARPQLNQVSSFLLTLSISPRAPPVA